MNQDDSPPVMASEECSRRIRRALRVELDQRWGKRGVINTAIGRGIEYLNKVCRGELPIKVDILLLALEVMDVDAGRFFANALGTRVENDALLKDLERFGEIHHRLGAIEKATVQIELSQPSGPAPPLADVEAMVSAVVACNFTEQRRRLGASQKYCHPAFVAAYLDHLDALRYDDPKVAGLNAWVVAVKLIPRLPGSRRERIALQLEAIGIFASTRRQKEDSATAARAIRFALTLARAHGLRQTTAELLQRGAYVLSGVGRYMDAMKLLDEALVIVFDLDLQAGLGSVLVDRGAHLYYLGEYHAAVAALEHALSFPVGESDRSNRSRLVAHQVLGRSFRRLGDLDRAEIALREAVAQSENAAPLYRASLLWDHGAIALACHSYEVAEERLSEAAQIFERLKDPSKALVALDLTKTFVAQGRTLEAVGLAATTAEYLTTLRGNKVAAAAVSELMHTVVRGRVSIDVIESVQDKLRPEQHRLEHNPPQEVRSP